MPEYRTIVECTSSLTLAIKNHLSDLSAQLLQRHLITAAQESQMRNKMHSPESRVATLVELIRDRVEQNPKHYQIFIEALEADQLANGDILELLKGKYESLSKGEHIIVRFLQALYCGCVASSSGHSQCVSVYNCMYGSGLEIGCI